MKLYRLAVLKLNGWWLSVSTLCMVGATASSAMSSGSPCCASPSCPIGLGSAALATGVLAFVTRRMRRAKPVVESAEIEIESVPRANHAFAMHSERN